MQGNKALTHKNLTYKVGKIAVGYKVVFEYVKLRFLLKGYIVCFQSMQIYIHFVFLMLIGINFDSSFVDILQ